MLCLVCTLSIAVRKEETILECSNNIYFTMQLSCKEYPHVLAKELSKDRFLAVDAINASEKKEKQEISMYTVTASCKC